MTNPIGAGVILVKMANEPLFLLLRGRDTGIWSFSKGHPESIDNRDLQRTAIRETQEETGFVAGRDYTLLPTGPIRFGKRPYWIGIVTDAACDVNRVRMAPLEHDMAGWFRWSEVMELRSNVDVRMWVRKTSGGSNPFCSAIQALRLVS
jgi:8-oxo-dGTP pyrophosphatase MutT (NUDIX family)